MKENMKPRSRRKHEYVYFGLRCWVPNSESDHSKGFSKEFVLFRNLDELLNEHRYPISDAARTQAYVIITFECLSNRDISRVCQLGNFGRSRRQVLTLSEYECRNGEWLDEEYIPVKSISRLASVTTFNPPQAPSFAGVWTV